MHRSLITRCRRICGLLVLGTALTGAAMAVEPTLVTASGRQVFWRGEGVGVTYTTPLPAPADVVVTLAPAGHAGRPVYRGTLTPSAGVGRLHLLLSTALLGDGAYTATAQAGGRQASVSFTVRETIVDSPGMVLNDNGGPGWVAPQARMANQTAAISFMESDFTGEQGPKVAEENRRFDALADGQILLWAQDATRPFSFNPPHSSPATDGEYRRRLVLGNAFRMRYPAFAGYLFDYDPCGYGIEDYNYNHLASYWGWGALAPQLKGYLDTQQQALIRTFKEETGFDALSADDAMRLAVAVRSPESMGYLDQPTRRWAYEIAARSPQMAPDALAQLKARGFAWYDAIMSLNGRRYTGYLGALRGLDPTLVHSTSNTINHSSPRAGNYHPSAYGPLDFRFVSVWDDQGGNPEHIYETALAATLLNGNRRSGQPLWIDTVFGHLPGNHWRNALLLAGRGAQGTGYSFEMGSSLTYGERGRKMLETNSPQNQEVALNARLMRQFGGLLTEARPSARAGLLYSKRQIAMTPYAQSYTDGMFKMLYLLSHVGLPPMLVTEEMLAGNGVPTDLDVIVVLEQHEALPGAAMRGLDAFVARGGRVVGDSASTVAWPFLEPSAALDLPFRDLGHPWNTATAYNRGDQTVGDMRALAAERGPHLRALLQDAIHHVPLDCSDPDVAVCTLTGGTATFATVVNDSMLDFSRLFSDEAKTGGIYQRFVMGADHGLGATSSWMPLHAALRLSPRLGDGVAVYDLFTRTRVQPVRRGGAQTIACDLTATSGRLYALYPAPVGVGTLAAQQTLRAGEMVSIRYQATDARGAALPAVVPVELTLRGPQGEALSTLYRATRADGVLADSLPTGVFLPAGRCRLEVRQLLDGGGVALPVTVQAGVVPPATLLTGATVRDPAAVRRFLATKPALVVPVFAPEMRPIAERVVAGLQQKGIAARVWLEPKTVPYALSYAVAPAEQPDNAAVDRGDAIGRVRFLNGRDHTNGNFYGSAFTGYRFGKPVVLLGLPGKNPVLDAVNASGLPWHDTATQSPGGALVQWLPQALSREADTLIVAAADLAGLEAGVQALLNPPATDPVTDGVRAARQRVLRGRGLPRGADASPAKGLTGTGQTTLTPPTTPARHSLVAVTDVQSMGDRLVASLGRYGQSAAIVDPQGRVTLLPAISTAGHTVCGTSVIVTTIPGLVSAWALTGELRWQAVGTFKALLPSDEVIVESGKTLYRVSPEGQFALHTDPLPAATPAPSVYKAEVVVETGPYGAVTLKGVRVLDTRSGQAVPGLTLTTEAAGPKQWRILQQFQESANGELLVAYRRAVQAPEVQLYRKTTGTVTTLSLPTDYLCAVALSADGTQVALAGREGLTRIVSATGTVLGEMQAGAYPRLFALRSGGFAVGSSDGVLTLVGADAKVLRVVDLDRETARAAQHPEVVYRRYRAAKVLSWFTPPTAAGAVPLDAFHLYLRDEHDVLRLVSWPAGKRVDFRWSDAVQGAVTFPKAGAYTITVTAAAKPFDALPMNQPSWDPILRVRDQVVTNERPAPAFTVSVNGKAVGTLTPAGDALQPFTTQRITVGWSKLDPKPAEFTTFTGTIEAPTGRALLGLAALGMTDCVLTEVRVEAR
jgi:hypothetical protein